MLGSFPELYAPTWDDTEPDPLLSPSSTNQTAASDSPTGSVSPFSEVTGYGRGNLTADANMSPFEWPHMEGFIDNEDLIGFVQALKNTPMGMDASQGEMGQIKQESGMGNDGEFGSWGGLVGALRGTEPSALANGAGISPSMTGGPASVAGMLTSGRSVSRPSELDMSMSWPAEMFASTSAAPPTSCTVNNSEKRSRVYIPFSNSAIYRSANTPTDTNTITAKTLPSTSQPLSFTSHHFIEPSQLPQNLLAPPRIKYPALPTAPNLHPLHQHTHPSPLPSAPPTGKTISNALKSLHNFQQQHQLHQPTHSQTYQYTPAPTTQQLPSSNHQTHHPYTPPYHPPNALLPLPPPPPTHPTPTERPDLPWSTLIHQTFHYPSPVPYLPVSEIYARIALLHPFFAQAQTNWRNGVRHALSVGRGFVNVPGKGWRVGVVGEKLGRKERRARGLCGGGVGGAGNGRRRGGVKVEGW
ncbi:hypothetical protein HDV00_005500 [Rhizophlyctis rosea]|nr:hypothetical protein HDV00_005500 [Rhizophlyctis rosea]